ncbi:hypothetical protein C2125_18370, partial [Rahnella aquatilis]
MPILASTRRCCRTCWQKELTLAPIFDAAKEQQRIDENRAIAQIGSQVADIVRTEGKIAAQEAAKNPDNLAAAKAAL